jgi:hypothetical protein
MSDIPPVSPEKPPSQTEGIGQYPTATNKKVLIGGSIIAFVQFIQGLIPGIGLGSAGAVALSFFRKNPTMNRAMLIKSMGIGAVASGLVQSVRTLVEVKQAVTANLEELHQTARIINYAGQIDEQRPHGQGSKRER